MNSGTEKKLVIRERTMEFDEMRLRELVGILLLQSVRAIRSTRKTNEIGIPHRAEQQIALSDCGLVDGTVDSRSS